MLQDDLPEHFQKSTQVLNFSDVSRDFLRELRGSRSQREVSAKMGYQFNQVGKWEAGFKQFKWSDFFNVCQVLGVAWETQFRDMFWTFQGEFNPASSYREIARSLVSSVYGARAQTSVDQTIRPRYNSNPSFSQVLQELDRQPGRLINFLTLFVNVKKIPTLLGRYREFEMSLDLISQEPRCVLINAALQIAEYQALSHHCDLTLSRHSCLDPESLKNLLNLMTALGLVRFDGCKYYPSGFDFSFSGLRLAKLRPLTKFVTRLASDKYPLDPINPSSDQATGPLKNSSVSSVRVTALSQQAATQVMSLVSQFHHQVTEIVRQDQAELKDNVQIILIHSFHTQV